MQRTVANPKEYNFHIGHATDSSGLGERNSDAYLIFPSITGGHSYKRGPIWYALLADGLGNDRGSHVASQLAVESTYQALTQSYGPKKSVAQQLEAALQHANGEVRNLASEDRTLQGMSTTMLAAAIHNERLYLINAGNCYAYLIRKGDVQRITPNRLTTRIDSDIVADAPFVGLLSQREEPVLHRLLGSGDRVELEHLQVDRDEPEPRLRIRIGNADDPSRKSSIVDHLPIQPGDIIVLCSGGMARATTKEEILSIASTYSPEDAAERLVRLARRRLSADDCTAVVLKWRGSTVPLRRMRNIQSHSSGLIAAAILLIVGVWLALSLSLNVSANWAQQNPSVTQPVAQPVAQSLVDPMSDAAALTVEDAAMNVESGVETGVEPGVELAPQTEQAATESSGQAGVPGATTELTTQLPTTQLPGDLSATGQFTTETTSAAQPQVQAGGGSTTEADAAGVQAIATPSNAELSVNIREHWNAFLQRSTSDGGQASDGSLPSESAPAEPAPAATPLLIPTATPTSESPGGIDAMLPSNSTVVPATQSVSDNEAGTHIVQPNDTLWDIATRYESTVEELLVANPHISSKDQTLTPGMEIYIP